jgi:hypothetical protein
MPLNHSGALVVSGHPQKSTSDGFGSKRTSIQNPRQHDFSYMSPFEPLPQSKVKRRFSSQCEIVDESDMPWDKNPRAYTASTHFKKGEQLDMDITPMDEISMLCEISECMKVLYILIREEEQDRQDELDIGSDDEPDTAVDSWNIIRYPPKTIETKSMLKRSCHRVTMNMQSQLQCISDEQNISDTTSASCSFISHPRRDRESSAQWKKEAGRSKSWNRSSRKDIIKLRR